MIIALMALAFTSALAAAVTAVALGAPIWLALVIYSVIGAAGLFIIAFYIVASSAAHAAPRHKTHEAHA
ncbi:hypothetical protein EDD53_1357 [Pacificibacter maritimus]|uniref:Uncharacterized protein n=1 Tax=Pacificibacter maritimus TaxID=762213 RepID=A0A3N4UAY9_9RHOB|nr:hypothetical protein [Pacificibacter maritimus]RPE66958.1 hypothetical protein EDD53_1357 [Pacificibacter maritimus]